LTGRASAQERLLDQFELAVGECSFRFL
jgi:hypothetical protein